MADPAPPPIEKGKPLRALIIVWLLPVVFVLSLILVAAAQGAQGGWTVFFAVLGVGALVALASGFCGSFFGFLFGMPRDLRRGQPEAPAAPPDAAADPARQETVASGDRPADAGKSGWANNNLVEVSDWLTKIVVGIGLVEFGTISAWVGKNGTLVGEGAGFTQAATQGAFGVAVILSGFVFGFLITYIYARTLISLIFASAARQVEDELSNKIAAATRIVRGVEQDLRSKLGEVREEVSVAKQEQAIVAKSIRAVVDTLPEEKRVPASVLTALYRPAPEGFTEAIALTDDLLAHGEHATNARLWAYRALALGQRFGFETMEGATDEARAQTADEALHALGEALRLDPTLRDWLVALWNPDAAGYVATEDDLVPFWTDETQRPRFAEALGAPL